MEQAPGTPDPVSAPQPPAQEPEVRRARVTVAFDFEYTVPGPAAPVDDVMDMLSDLGLEDCTVMSFEPHPQIAPDGTGKDANAKHAESWPRG